MKIEDVISESPYKNKEELYFSYYLDELIDEGLLLKYEYEVQKFELSPDVQFTWTKKTQLKTKLKVEHKEKSLLKACTYTPDFILYSLTEIEGLSSTSLMNDIPILLICKGMTVVDVKGAFAGRTNSTQYTFPLKQKWLYDNYKLYTNKIVPDKLFQDTFTPAKVIAEEVYRRDNKNRGIKEGDSKLKFNPLTIKEWLAKQKQSIY